MTNNNDFTDDLFKLNEVASKYLLQDENILLNLEKALRNDSSSSQIIDKYKTLSNLLSLGFPGPGWLEISSPIYFWNITILVNQILLFSSINYALVTENNKILNSIYKEQIPDLINRLDKILSLIEAIPNLIKKTEINISNLFNSYFKQLYASIKFIDSYLQNNITPTLNQIVNQLDNIVTQFLEQNTTLFKENLDNFSENTSEMTSLKIVGESYYKWDSENIYAPTVFFLFEENLPTLKRRRSRVSIKLPYTRETLPDNIVQILQDKIQSYPILQYNKGNIKSTFVHPTYKWRTTFFVKNKRDARNILKYISNIGDIEYLPEGLSYTQGRKPLRFTRLERPLPGINLRDRTNEGEYTVILTRVVLLISNSDSPIVIWKNIR